MLDSSNRRGLRGFILNRALSRVSETGKDEAEQLLYAPRKWFRGEDLPQEHLRPWEKLLWGLGATMRNMGNGFDQGREVLWRTHFEVNPMLIFAQTMVNTIWDGVTDPLIGQWMDRNPWRDSSYRWIIRIQHTVWRTIYVLFMLDLGFSPIQRVAFFAIISGALNITSTMRDIAEEKYLAGVTPLTQERSKLFVWQHVFHKLGYPVSNLPFLIMGLFPHLQDYQIFTRGFTALIPMAVAGGILPTLLRNRVSFAHTRNAKQAESSTEEKITLRESFAVIKHNKFLLYWMVANFINQLVPEFHMIFIWRFIVPNMHMFGREFGGTMFPWFFGQFSGLPITFLAPFMRQIVHFAGGPKRTMVYDCASNIAVRIGQYFIGINSPGAMVGHFALDTLRETTSPIADVANRMLEFEMLDYVELQTGVRSEGINRSIIGFIEKMLKNNISSFAGNIFQAWAGVHHLNRQYHISQGYGYEAAPQEDLIARWFPALAGDPARFMRYAFPVAMLGGALRSVIMLVARASFPYQYGQHEQIEAELAARRALAEQTKQELESTTV